MYILLRFLTQHAHKNRRGQLVDHQGIFGLHFAEILSLSNSIRAALQVVESPLGTSPPAGVSFAFVLVRFRYAISNLAEFDWAGRLLLIGASQFAPHLRFCFVCCGESCFPSASTPPFADFIAASVIGFTHHIPFNLIAPFARRRASSFAFYFFRCAPILPIAPATCLCAKLPWYEKSCF